jgi:lysyl-tRNA synthetase class 2
MIEAPDGTALPRYLRTSPEFACKKLLAAGERRVVEFAKVFRNRERGALHHPEFTLIEWYRAGEPYEAMMGDCIAILRAAARVVGTRNLTFRGRLADVFAEPERLSVAEAFARHAGIDLLATLPDGAPDRAAFAAAAQAADIRVADDDTWGDIFSRVLVERVEHNLGIGRATILDEYPATLSALARPARDPRVAKRFEIYACSAGGSSTKWRRRNVSTAPAIRSTKILSQPLPKCRGRPASRLDSTAWSCWRPEPRASIRYYGRRCLSG